MKTTYQVDLILEEIELLEHALMTYRNVEINNYTKEQHPGVKESIAERINRDNETTANIIEKLNNA